MPEDARDEREGAQRRRDAERGASIYPLDHGPPEDCVEKDDAAADSGKPAASAEPDRSSPHPQGTDENRNPGDERHKRAERRYWTVTSVASVAAAIGTGVAAWYAIDAYKAALQTVRETHEQAVQAQRQADIAREGYVASNRAWLDVSVDQNGLLLKWKEDGGAILYSQLRGINLGNSPAIEARLSGSLIVDRGPPDLSPKEVVKHECVEWSPLNGGDTAFMKEPFVDINAAYISRQDIRTNLDRQPTNSLPDGERQATNLVLFYFVACAMYRVAGDSSWHHTGRIYRVMRLDDGADGKSVSPFLRIGEDLGGDRISLAKQGVGAYTD